MIKYKVRLIMDQTYEVIEIWDTFSKNGEESSVYQGTLSDCKSYIRLKEGKYM